MARWRLDEDHYINAMEYGQATEWEYTETDRVSGRPNRKRFKVPLYIDKGRIVCHEGSEQEQTDIIFEGEPTPGMVPIDAEAKKLSAELQKKWVDPMGAEVFPSNGFSDRLLYSLEQSISKLGAVPAATSGVSKEQFDQMQKQMIELMDQNAKLMVKIEGKEEEAEVLPELTPAEIATAVPAPTRRVGRR